MDPLEFIYDSIDQVPESFRDLYTEQDGKVVLTKVNGIKTHKDVSTLQEALRKERSDHALAKEALRPWKNLGDDPSKIQSILDRVPELEAAASGKLDDEALQKLVEARIGQKTGPLERQLREFTSSIEDLKKENSSLRGAIETRDLNDLVRSVATEMKVIPSAIEDIEMIAGFYFEKDQTSGEFIVKSDVKGITPGADMKTFLREMQNSRPHWWPNSAGGGAGGGNKGFGSSKENPWSKDGWNLTSQGRYIREHGQAKAEEAAKAAGSRIGASRPQQK